jgi:cytochrome c peroxidase
MFFGHATFAEIIDLPRPLVNADFHNIDAMQARLGQKLFYDKILSGNQNISCGTCHHHRFGGSDGLSLGIGEGGIGIGPTRLPGFGDSRIKKRVPRNASALWNIGAKEVKILFQDGRLSVSDEYENGFNSPAEEWLPNGLDTILAAQAILPMTAQFEMAGNPKENEVAGATHDRIDAVWPIIAKRVRVIPAYGQEFVEAFDDVDTADQVDITHIAKALGAFIGQEWRSHDSPFDAYIAGDETALDASQKRGLDLFYGKANCASCHSGPLLSDHKFYALALPPFGPGRTRRFDPYVRDVGRMGESDDLADAYRFKTPQLRNIALTGPYGHNGAYASLENMVRHHLNPMQMRDEWKPEMAQLPKAEWLEAIDFVVMADKREMARQRSHLDIKPIQLNDREIDDLVTFLHSLTGANAMSLPLGVPESVPSGLPIDR